MVGTCGENGKDNRIVKIVFEGHWWKEKDWEAEEAMAGRC
jgi:hypothetical protein